MIGEEEEMMSETEAMESEDETEHEVEHQGRSDLSLLTFRRRE
jgi:hypothetical protein